MKISTKARIAAIILHIWQHGHANAISYGDIDIIGEMITDYEAFFNWDWSELPADIRQHFQDLDWDETKWDGDEDDDKYDSPEYTYDLDWDILHAEQRRALEELGWNEEMWQSEDILSTRAQNTPWSGLTSAEQDAAEYLGFDSVSWFVKPANETEFNPEVTHLDIPELQKFNLDYFQSLDIPVNLCDGNTLGDDEECHKNTTMSDFVSDLRKGSLHYLKYEDNDPFKEHIQSTIGDLVLKYLRGALSQSHLRENGQYPSFYDDVEVSEKSWVFWLGGKNTSTSMHHDEDRINFLWVVEGRKRVVVIPNDERTRGTYNCTSQFMWHSCWTGIDILSGGSKNLPPYAVEIELGPGDGILIPFMAWHAVENIEATVAFGLRHDLPEN